MKREILMADSAGYCFGVRRVIHMAEETAANGNTVHTLGPIIHNPRKIEELEAEGVHAIEDAAAVDGGTVIVRAHGIPRDMQAAAEARGVNLVDGTCPYVTNSQQHAKELSDAGYRIVIVGDREHPEIVGVLSYIADDPVVVRNAGELPRFGPKDRVGVIAQTTLQKDVYTAVVTAIADQAYEVRAFNTICFETDDRQEAARKLAAEVEAMVVVGGRNSKNTEHLAQICRDVGVRTVKVESAGELDPAFFDGIARIGVTAGASTPDEQVAEVVTALHALDD